MASVFRFKQFSVNQEDCAMRINTDGVLLGAYAHVEEAKFILDIGTGTGVIALMLAQRFAQAQVHAIEIDAPAAARAQQNALQSPFAERLEIRHQDLADFSATQHYELIVSNPPFFINDLKNPELKKSTARHTEWLFFEQLMLKTQQYLHAEGHLALVVPPKIAAQLQQLAAKKELYLKSVLHLHSDAEKSCFRQILTFSKQKHLTVTQDSLYIYEALNVHTHAYKTYLKDFFLAF